MPIKVNLKPVVIQGGTFESAVATSQYSEFNVFNNCGSPDNTINEKASLKMFFDYTEEDLGDKVRVTFKGIKNFTFTINPVGNFCTFSITNIIRDHANNEVKTYKYTSGVNYSLNDSFTPSSPFSQFTFELPKVNGVKAINKKLARFDDVGVIAEGNNFIELWIDNIVYVAPPDIKPWAIRKSGRFKTHSRPSGWFKIRKSGSWADKSTQDVSHVRQPNAGKHRIRKSGTWLGQNKIGEL